MPTIPIIGTSVWLIIKLAVLFALLIYIAFAVVVIKQVNLMAETLEVDFDKVIRTVASLHLVFAISVFFLALIIL